MKCPISYFYVTRFPGGVPVNYADTFLYVRSEKWVDGYLTEIETGRVRVRPKYCPIERVMRAAPVERYFELATSER